MNLLSLAPTTMWDAQPMEFLDAAIAAGFGGVGLRLNPSPNRPFYPVAGNAPLIREMKRKIDGAGLQPLDIFTYYVLPEINLAQYAATLEAGAELGGKYCVLNCDDPDWSRMRDNMGRITDLAAPLGITACIEFVATLQLGTLQKALLMVKELDRPNLKITIDSSHLARSGGTIDELRDLDPKLFPFTQIADGVIGPDGPPTIHGSIIGPVERRLPGEGELPVTELLDVMPRGLPLSIETGSRPDGMSMMEWAQRIMDGTRRFLDAYYRTRS